MVVIMAAARGAHQGEECVGADRIAEVSTDQGTQEPETARLSSLPIPRHYVETDEASESTMPHAAVTGTNSLTTDAPPQLFRGIPNTVAGIAAEQRGLLTGGGGETGTMGRLRRRRRTTASMKLRYRAEWKHRTAHSWRHKSAAASSSTRGQKSSRSTCSRGTRCWTMCGTK